MASECVCRYDNSTILHLFCWHCWFPGGSLGRGGVDFLLR